MSKQKRRTKLQIKDTTKKQDETKINPYKGELFSEADAKAMEMSGYWPNFGSSESEQIPQDRSLPVGVVGVDKSVKLPPVSPRINPETKPDIPTQRESPNRPIIKYPTVKPSYPNYVRMPLQSLTNGHDDTRLVEFYPLEGDNNSSHSHRHSHHSHKHHHHHHHHNHRHRHSSGGHRHHHHHHQEYLQDVETHDPRWWYLTPGTVHGPRPNQTPNYIQFSPPKWYDPPNFRGKFFIDSRNFASPVHRYEDCRCEVCRPSMKTPRGYRWVVHQ